MPAQQWYPDPTGRHEMRYWDGQRWTDHVSDRGVQGMDAVAGPPGPGGYGPGPSASPGMGWGAPSAPPSYQPGPGGFGYAGAPSRTVEHPQGTTILVLGILSLVCCGLLGPVAWGMGHTARREMRSNPEATYTNQGNVTAGWICGIIATCLLALGVLIFIIVASAGGFNDSLAR